MTGRTTLILLTMFFFCACANGGGKHQEKTGQEAVPAEQVDAENYNKIGENLQAFLSENGAPLKGWPFKEWGWKVVGDRMEWSAKLDGEKIEGEVRKEFLSLDVVNGYGNVFGESRSKWQERLFKSNTEYWLCGMLDVSDALDCYVYTAVDETVIGYRDAFALLVKDGQAVGRFQLACEGYGDGNSLESNRISRNTFVMSSRAIDVIDENGENPHGYYFIRVRDDGKVSRTERATESDFNKPSWTR